MTVLVEIGAPLWAPRLFGRLMRGMKSLITACRPAMAAMVMVNGSVPFGSIQMATSSSGWIWYSGQRAPSTSRPLTSTLMGGTSRLS
ncbi:hypothetical protein D9M68_933220 [compost metagenome]